MSPAQALGASGAAGPPNPAGAVNVARPPRILIADDTPTKIRVLEAVLAPRGYAASGLQWGRGRPHPGGPGL
jgi:hypothetical protein